MLHEYVLNLWYVLADTGTGRHVIMMHYRNGEKSNLSWAYGVN